MSRGRTISYQPGICIPKFCLPMVSAAKPILRCNPSNIRCPSFCCDTHGHYPLHILLGFLYILVGLRRTTVIGMAGAFGKMKATSSNLPLLRQFSARLTLKRVRGLVRRVSTYGREHTSQLRYSAQCQSCLFNGGLDGSTYLSPSPCAMMTVAVCFFSAGTTSAAGPAILYGRQGSLFELLVF